MPHLVPIPAEISVVPRLQWEKRRCEPRYHCGPATLGRFVTAQAEEIHRAWVLNLSTHGTGLLLIQPLALETLLVLHLKSTLGDRNYTLPGRVVHATVQLSGDWLVGCEFADPLNADDLDALL
jgi:PilZ domain